MTETLQPAITEQPTLTPEIREQTPEERLAILQNCFLNLAGCEELDEETLAHIRTGGGIRLLLHEIRLLSDDSEQDQIIEHARDRFMDMFLPRSPLVNRDMHDWSLNLAEEAYIDAMVGKIFAHLDAQTPEEILALQQMPSLVQKTRFADGEEIDSEDFIGNHLYIILDTLLKEHVHRTEAIAAYRRSSIIARVAGNRALRFALGGLTFGAAVAAHMGVLEAEDEDLATSVEIILKGMSGGLLLFEIPELVRHKGSVFRQKRKRKKLHNQLADGFEMSDHAMLLACGEPRFGDRSAHGVVTDRGGSDDKATNLERFERLDETFLHFNNDPGGRPYTGAQALTYSARFLIEHRDLVDAIVEPKLSVSERRARYEHLARVLAQEDLNRMKKNQSPHALREFVLDAFLVGVVAESPETTSVFSDAKTLGRDMRRVHLHESEENQKA